LAELKFIRKISVNFRFYGDHRSRSISSVDKGDDYEVGDMGVKEARKSGIDSLL
jgi:hypothetical protein